MNDAYATVERPVLDRTVRGVQELRRPHGLLARCKAFLDDVEAGALAPRAFTCVLPLESLTPAERLQLLGLLRALNAPDSPLLEVFGVRRVRFSVLENTPAEAPYGALVFSCLHEGDREELLYELFEHPSGAFDSALGPCRDYAGPHARAACVRQLLAAAVERDAKKLVRNPVRLHLDREHDGLFDRLRRRAQAVLHMVAPPAANDPRDPLRLNAAPNFEDAPGVASLETSFWTRRGALVVRHALRRNKRATLRTDPAATIRRGFHTKHHGLVRATFVVPEDLDPGLACGVFQPGRRYPAWLRLSNMTGSIKPDGARDARGLAIKLEGVGDGQLQDFLLASHPVFVTKDARDYTLLNSIAMAHDKLPRLPRALVFVLRRPREVGILMRARWCRIGHPLALAYHSMTAYAFGSDAVKYLVRPCEPIDAPVPLPWKRSPDFLRDRLRESLLPGSGAGLKLEFCLVAVPKGARPPIEDARADWTKDSHVVRIATIEIAPQDPSTPERMRAAEQMVFTPWHALTEHLPLGSLARARFAVYRESAAQRAQSGATATDRPFEAIDDQAPRIAARESVSNQPQLS